MFTKIARWSRAVIGTLTSATINATDINGPASGPLTIDLPDNGLLVSGLPTSDPMSAGLLYNDGGIIKISLP